MSRPNFNDMDWQSVLDSEVFRNYMQSELKKEAEHQSELSSPEYLKKQAEEKLRTLQELNDFREKVASSPKLLEYFKQCKKILASNKEIAKKVDPKFIEGIKLLRLAMDDNESEDSDILEETELSGIEAEQLYSEFNDYLNQEYGTDVYDLNPNVLSATLKQFCDDRGFSQNTCEKFLNFVNSKKS